LQYDLLAEKQSGAAFHFSLLQVQLAPKSYYYMFKLESNIIKTCIGSTFVVISLAKFQFVISFVLNMFKGFLIIKEPHHLYPSSHTT